MTCPFRFRTDWMRPEIPSSRSVRPDRRAPRVGGVDGIGRSRSRLSTSMRLSNDFPTRWTVVRSPSLVGSPNSSVDVHSTLR